MTPPAEYPPPLPPSKPAASSRLIFGGAAADLPLTPDVLPTTDTHLVQYLQGLSCANAQHHETLSLVPLLRHDPPHREILTLAEALPERKAKISEIHYKGHLPKLYIENRTDQPLLALAGETLTGGRQDRVIQATALVPPKGHCDLDTAGIEQSRWEPQRDHDGSFSLLPSFLPPLLQAQQIQAISKNLRRGQSFLGEQKSLWYEIAHLQRHLKDLDQDERYATLCHALAQAPEQEPYLEAFKHLDEQVGFIAFWCGHFLMLSLTPHPDIAALTLPRQINALHQHTLTAPEPRSQRPPPSADEGQSILEVFWQITAKARPSLGLGDDLRFQIDTLLGAGLAHNDHLLHLVAYPRLTR